MRLGFGMALAGFLALGVAGNGMAQGMLVDDFSGRPETRWQFFTDGVMGGVSTGGVTFPTEGGRTHAHMTGSVSTANNGGFIQIRVELSEVPADAQGIRLVTRGNGQRYFVHLRTSGTVLPWQYYQAGFDVTPSWSEIRLPFTAFAPSSGFLRGVPLAGSLRSIGVVAFGRDHRAEVDVREIGFY